MTFTQVVLYHAQERPVSCSNGAVFFPQDAKIQADYLSLILTFRCVLTQSSRGTLVPAKDPNCFASGRKTKLKNHIDRGW